MGCVDTRAARAAIRDAVSNWSTVSYWLDLGNNADSGQFILGEPLNERNRRARLRLRSASELYPEIVDASLDKDGEPSCSAIEALQRQESFINSTLAQHALASSIWKQGGRRRSELPQSSGGEHVSKRDAVLLRRQC